jgi:hypothetical protein
MTEHKATRCRTNVRWKSDGSLTNVRRTSDKSQTDVGRTELSRCCYNAGGGVALQLLAMQRCGKANRAL